MSSIDPHHFFVACEPPTATQQEKGIRMISGKDGKKVPKLYPKPSWEKARDYIASRLEMYRPAKPVPKGVAVELSVTWCFRSDGFADGAPHVTKPDTDNLDKGLKDIMTDLGWWADDCQVFSEHVVKVWSRVSGIRIDIETIEVPS